MLHLSEDQVTGARNAFLLAEHIGTPLNTFITVIFRDMKGRNGWVSGDQSAEQIGRLRDRLLRSLRNACNERGQPHALVYVLENPPQGGRGPHIHLLMHLPVENYAAQVAWLDGLIRKVMGWTTRELKAQLADLRVQKRVAISTEDRERIWLPFVIQGSNSSQEIPLNYIQAETNLAYIAKGLPENQTVQVGGRDYTLEQVRWLDGGACEPQGDVRVSKRMGVSDTIGRKARCQAGWQERVGLEWLSRRNRERSYLKTVRKMLKELFAARDASSSEMPFKQ